MKVAVYHNLPSGGALKVLEAWFRYHAADHHVELFIPQTANDDFARLSPYAVATHRFPLAPVKSFFDTFLQIRGLAKVGSLVADAIDQGGFDVVLASASQFTQAPEILPHLHTPSVYFAPEYNRMIYDKPLTRGPKQELKRLLLYPRRTWIKRIDKKSIVSATTVFTNSKFTRANLRRIYGIDSEVVYNGVDNEAFQPRKLQREQVVLSVGSLAPVKGHGFVIDALATIPPEQRPTLVVIGDRGAGATQLTAQARRLEVKIETHENVPLSELVNYYNRATVLAAAQYAEPFGLTALEAMACETPVVAVAEGGLTESVNHNTTGILVERDPVLYGQALLRVLSDRTLARRLGENGRKDVVARWQWAQTAKRIERLLNTANRKHHE